MSKKINKAIEIEGIKKRIVNNKISDSITST